MTLADAPDFLTMEETAQILRIGRNQVYELARVWRATGGERGVPVVEFGRRLRVPKAALLRLAGLEPAGAERERLSRRPPAAVGRRGPWPWATGTAPTRCSSCWTWRARRSILMRGRSWSPATGTSPAVWGYPRTPWGGGCRYCVALVWWSSGPGAATVSGPVLTC